MYAASQSFHNAVRDGAHQMPLLIFSDTVFTEEDIDVDAGIEFDDNFNMEEDIAIGQATSNEIRFTMINDTNQLNNYLFGEFIATIGVQINKTNYSQSGDVMLVTSRATYVGSSTTPYIQRNGTTLTRQPTFPVKNLMFYEDAVWCWGANGEFAVFNDRTGLNVTSQYTASDFMKDKVKKWRGVGYAMNGRVLTIYDHGIATAYEFVPLGTFIAERPNAPDQIRISFICYDRMTKFDKDMPTKETLGLTYPTTIGTLFTKLCDYVGVPYRTNTFVNSTANISKEPEAFEGATMRQVLMWIAEAAGSNARFDRDGYLVMDWLKQTNQQYDEHDYMEFVPFWYETPKVGVVYNRTTDCGVDTTFGEEGAEYLIQDNPLMASLNASARNALMRQKRKESMEKENRKIQHCLNPDGSVNYDKLNYLSDDEELWAQEAEEWDILHPSSES